MTEQASSINTFGKLLTRALVAFAPLRQSSWMWLETVVIPLCAIALGLIVDHENPYQIGGEFPWVWIAPVLIALRYGVMPGIVSSFILVGVWELLAFLAPGQGSFPEQYFLGGFIVVMLCGEFSAVWGSRLRQAEETNRYLDERMSRITTRHLLLRLSHDRMEQEILTKPVTLRDALIGLRQLTAEESNSPMPASSSLLQLLTQYCQLESAAIYIPAAGGKYTRTSEIGFSPELSPTDPLLLHALEHKSLSHLLTEGLADTKLPSPFLVVAPIQASDGYLLGILAVDSMPFLALNEETLQMLSVMISYYADCVVEAAGVRQFVELFPSAPPDFAAEFPKLLRLQRNYNIESHIVTLSFGNDENGRRSLTQLARIRRGLDIIWQVELKNRIVLVNLMPLTGKAAVASYILRIDTLLKENMGTDYNKWSVTPIEISLSATDPVATLAHALDDTAT
jgi:polysaccharide biosynthesis protein PelD